MYAADIFLFFLICCGYGCIHAIFVKCVAFSVSLESAVFVHDPCLQIKIIFLSLQGQPTFLHLSVGTKIIGMIFVISAPSVEYIFYHNAIVSKIVNIIVAVHVSYVFHLIAVFRLEIVVIRSDFFHAF